MNKQELAGRIKASSDGKLYDYNKLKFMEMHDLVNLYNYVTLKDLKKNIQIIINTGELLWTGEIFNIGKVGDVNLNYQAKTALNEIKWILEDSPEFKSYCPIQVLEMLEGKVYEGIFKDMKEMIKC